MIATALAPYRALFGARFRSLLQYRAAALAGFGTQCWWGVIKVMVLAAFYASAPGEHPLTLTQVITYTWLGQGLLGMLPWTGDGELQQMVRTGNIAYEFLRPVDIYGFWYVRALSGRAVPTILRLIPMVLLVGVALPFAGLGDWALKPPSGWQASGLFAISITATLLLSSAFSTLINISMLWTVSGYGLNNLAMPVVVIFSGMIVPLPLFPDWMQWFLNILPFRGLVDVPYRIYFADLTGMDAAFAIAHQVGWTVALIILGHWLMGRGMKRAVVQGG